MNHLRNSRSILSRLRILIRRPPPPSPSGITPHHHHVCKQPRRLVQRKVTAATGAAIAARVRYGETVPFTGRTHLVVESHRDAREAAESEFAKFKTEHAAEILDDSHPATLRVRRIGSEVVTAAHSAFSIISTNKHPHPHRDDGLNWVDGLPWEVIVVDNGDGFVRCYPGVGKILVHTEFLHRFSTDAEIAAALAHEVGHVVARHGSEMASRWSPPIFRKLPFLYLAVLPLFRRNEVEADHIGMLLLAAAGYHPHAALRMLRKFEEIELEEYRRNSLRSRIRSFIGVHPSSRKRWQFLVQPEIMEEALELHREAAAAVVHAT